MREFAMLVPKFSAADRLNRRNMRCHNTSHVGYFRRMHYQESLNLYSPLNWYYSLAIFKDGVPRNKVINKAEWNKMANSQMVGYDFLLDIDAGSLKDVAQAYQDAKKILAFFLSFNLPVEVDFSGRGFHIKMAYDLFVYHGFSLIQGEDNTIYDFYIKIAKLMTEKFSEMIDLGIYDFRRLCKVPGSLATYDNGVYVCYQFNSVEEFMDFNIDNYKFENYWAKFRPVKLRHPWINDNYTKDASKFIAWIEDAYDKENYKDEVYDVADNS